MQGVIVGVGWGIRRPLWQYVAPIHGNISMLLIGCYLGFFALLLGIVSAGAGSMLLK